MKRFGRRNNSEYEEYFGSDSIVIEEPGLNKSLLEHEDNKIDVLLSTNYEDIYLIHTGPHQIVLPPFVDVKFETNMADNPYKLLRKYTLVLN